MTAVDVLRGIGRLGRLAPWIAVAAAPAAWMAHLLVSYLLVPVACGQGSNALLHATTLVTALAAVGGGAVAARSWEQSRDNGRDNGRGAAFIALTGLVISPLFVLVILVGGTSTLLIEPCAG